MTAAYGERLGSDYARLGYAEFGLPFNGYADVRSTLQITSTIYEHNLERGAATTPTLLQTQFGRLLHGVIMGQGGVVEQLDNHNTCCEWADASLLQNMDYRLPPPDGAASWQTNRGQTGPIIITDQITGQALLVLKASGEATCYALRSDPRRGIVGGAFYEQHSFDADAIGQLPEASAWKVPIEAFPNFHYLRMGMFTLALHPRRTFIAGEPYRQQALETNHSSIVAKAARLLIEAQPIPGLQRRP